MESRRQKSVFCALNEICVFNFVFLRMESPEVHRSTNGNKKKMIPFSMRLCAKRENQKKCSFLSRLLRKEKIWSGYCSFLLRLLRKEKVWSGYCSFLWYSLWKEKDQDISLFCDYTVSYTFSLKGESYKAWSGYFSYLWKHDPNTTIIRKLLW